MNEYPELNESGIKEHEQIMDKFKSQMIEIVEETLSNSYCDVSHYIESDSWSNYRRDIMKGLKGYPSLLKYDFREVRKLILEEHRDQIIQDINEDLLREVQDLKSMIEDFRNSNREY